MATYLRPAALLSLVVLLLVPAMLARANDDDEDYHYYCGQHRLDGDHDTYYHTMRGNDVK